MIDIKSIKNINVAILLAATLAFASAAYSEDSPPSPSSETIHTSLDEKPIDDKENKKAEVKQLALPEKAAVHEDHSDKPHTTKGKKSRKKSANELMSSDDTTREYARAIDPALHYEKARHLALERKYSEALKEVNEALIQNPKYYEAKYLGALIFEREGRKQEAASKYKQILLEKPNYLQAQISYASLLADLGQSKASEAEYRKAIDLSFMSWEGHYDLANLLTKENRFKEALQELRICLKLKPDSAAVHNNMGVIFYHQNYKDESEKEFRQASELDPANKIYVHNLELVQSGDKKTEIPSLG
jgi:Flp pilus assembly protein TadD